MQTKNRYQIKENYSREPFSCEHVSNSTEHSILEFIDTPYIMQSKPLLLISILLDTYTSTYTDISLLSTLSFTGVNLATIYLIFQA